MRIRRFTARDIHGYLSFDVPFNDDLTFLTGINGSGKTTVVNSIAALISPSFDVLAGIDFLTMAVDVVHAGESIRLEATRDEDSLSFSAGDPDEALIVPILDEFSEPRAKRIDFYREQKARHASHPVMKVVMGLPTPMYLGIERRSKEVDHFDEQMTAAANYRARRMARNVFPSSLAYSLLQARNLAERSYKAIQSAQFDAAEKLRKKMLVAALKYEGAWDATSAGAAVPRIENIPTIKATLARIGLSEDEIERQLEPFVQRLKAIEPYQPFDEPFEELTEEKDPEKFKAYLEWYINRPQIERITSMLRLVEAYNNSNRRAFKPIEQYLSTVNRFLADSEKELIFEGGNLRVKIQDREARPVTALSSGESQLVVILTHLAFNPAAREANVFIVDEPELSLHLRWQELFVDAVRTVNPDMQAILATHSPSIILDDIEHCFDLSTQQK